MISASIKGMAGVLGILGVGGTTIAAATEWPPLPASGFISGRAAQQDDIAKGNAVFVAIVNNVRVGKPLAVAIPQYGRLRTTHEPVIVVQAEDTNGMKVYGVRGLDGHAQIVMASDVELLGRRKPAD